MSDTDDTEYGYTEWRCENCGHGVPKNNPPCSRCGNMRFEQVVVRESDFDEATRVPSTAEVLRDNARLAGASVAVVLVVAVVGLASAGVFVLSDPLGLGYRYGAVDAAPDDGDGTLTAAELHGRVAAEHADASLRWRGRELRLSYRTTAASNAVVATELVQVAEWYAAYVDDGGDAARLRITATVGERGRARVTVERADAAAFADGTLSRSEYRTRVLGSSGDG
ncbi:MAG: hypothetical protein ABEH47_03095 [Haloferacaceae archaeon]